MTAVRRTAGQLWHGRASGPLARVLLSALAVAVAAEVLFGRRSTGTVPGLSFWNGIAGGLLVNGAYIAVVVVAGATLVGLASLLRFTRIGIAIRACAENADRAALLGIPVQRVTTLVWVLATVLAGVAAFLRGPVVGLP